MDIGKRKESESEHMVPFYDDNKRTNLINRLMVRLSNKGIYTNKMSVMLK